MANAIEFIEGRNESDDFAELENIVMKLVHEDGFTEFKKIVDIILH